MWSGQWPGQEPAGSGRGLKYDNCVAGWTWTYFLRAGPHNSVCGPGLHNCCGPWASNHICGSSLGLNFRLVQAPTVVNFGCLEELVNCTICIQTALIYEKGSWLMAMPHVTVCNDIVDNSVRTRVLDTVFATLKSIVRHSLYLLNGYAC